jgi:hypothetical protein
MVYISDTFDVSMIPSHMFTRVEIERISIHHAVGRLMNGFVSLIEDTTLAQVVSSEIGAESKGTVPPDNFKFSFSENEVDTMVVVRYYGSPLRPGATRLPEDGGLVWFSVSLRTESHEAHTGGQS